MPLKAATGRALYSLRIGALVRHTPGGNPGPGSVTAAAAADRKVTVTATAVTGASSYRFFRDDGPARGIQAGQPGAAWTSAVLSAGTYTFSACAVVGGVETARVSAGPLLVDGTPRSTV